MTRSTPRELVGRGVAIHLAPTDQTWGDREMCVRDPDGNGIRFIRPGLGRRGPEPPAER